MRSRNAWLLLALPSLLGCSDYLVVAFTFAVAALVCLPLSGLALMPLRGRLDSTGQVIALLLLAATLLSCISMALRMHSMELTDSLGPYLPLLALPCAGLALHPGAKPWSGLRAGATVAGLAMALGSLREALGQATLLQHADWLFGARAYSWPITLGGLSGLPLLVTVPGGFILLGALLALARCLSPANQDRR